jgi:hypothetical protein
MEIKAILQNEFISEDNTLDGKVSVPVVLKCLSLTVVILLPKPAHESMSLTVFAFRLAIPSSSCNIEEICHKVKSLDVSLEN